VTLAFTAPVVLSNVSTLSDLKIDGTTVTGFAADTLAYNVELATGTTTVPTVTATTTDSKASAVVTPATGLPGATTIVVTAEDGTTMKTYTINFTVVAPALKVSDFGNYLVIVMSGVKNIVLTEASVQEKFPGITTSSKLNVYIPESADINYTATYVASTTVTDPLDDTVVLYTGGAWVVPGVQIATNTQMKAGIVTLIP
jgi:hypothetical protein